MSMLLIPVQAWSYGDPAKADDTKFENFGPRADRLLIKLYASETSEWDTGLETNQIDVTDWPLDEAHYNRYTTPPWDASVKVMGYGAEFGLYLFDLNNNNELYLGNPPNLAYPNPVYPNPMSELSMRKAVAYLSNRPKIVSNIGWLVAMALYTPVGPSAGKFSHPDIQPGGAREDLCYLYNPAAAAAILTANWFPIGPDGWRYWDQNHNGVKDAGEDFSLKIVARVDSPIRDFAGSDLYIELTNIKIHCTIQHMPSGAARIQVMADKNFHIYTGGWSLGVDPDFLILWNWDYYWHPGRPYNYAGCNNADFNEASNGVHYANDQLEAVYWALRGQIAFAENVLSVPLWAGTVYKAVKRTYTGTPGVPDGEDAYEGRYWEGFVDVPGYGPDSSFSFLNMHPQDYAYGDGSMTVRWGFKTQAINMLNPIYAEMLWDNKVIDTIGYDSLLVRNPYNLGQFQPWMAMQYSVSTYTHPVYGTGCKVVFTLRPGVEWSDGTPVTLADIYFTFVELDDLLAARGLPPPWWISNVVDVLSFSFLDAQNFEVLLDCKSVFVAGWISQNRILPKHIWKPIIMTGDPTTFMPDPNMINSGAWRLKEYVENSHVLLLANKPGATVQTNLAGSTPVTSNMGFFRYYPVIEEPWTGSSYYYYKIPRSISDLINPRPFNFTFRNEAQVPMNISYTITGEFPNGTVIPGLPSASNVIMPAISTLLVQWTTEMLYGVWRFHVEIYEYMWINGQLVKTFHWYWGKTMYWITITEDICGSTWYDQVGMGSYPYKNELPCPDIQVDTQDVERAAHAFGSYPGMSKWSTVADITHDYMIDIKDTLRIGDKFGWRGSPYEVDVAVIEVRNMKTDCVPLPTVCRNMTMQVYVTVENQGDLTETFNVTAYANTTAIGEQTVTLNSKQNTTLTFTWMTTGLTEYTNYTMSATADTLAGETDTVDNTLSDGTVTITHTGDITGDRKCDIQDLSRVSGAFGSLRVNDPKDSQYGKYRHPVACSTCPHQPNTDVTGDSKVDIQDLARTSANFGWHP
jgi:ABC-type transport system substrate-binding protein